MIYLDNSATTAMYPEILDIIKKYAVDNYYNPSALYTKALDISNDIKQAKQKILDILKGSGNICFTASGTEADNMAMFGVKKFKDCKILLSSIEHSAIYQCAKRLESQGVQVEYVKVDNYGIVDEEDFVKLTKKVAPKAIFHSDGVQAVGKMPINLNKLGVDLYTFSAHKFHGMKGVGCLYIKKGVNINPIIFGGGQENGLRSATENVAGIISTAYALEKIYKNLDIQKNTNIIASIKENLVKLIPNCKINTDTGRSLSNILSFAIPNTRGEVLVHLLEDKGIIIGTGSACSAQKAHTRVPIALGLSKEYFDGMIRISISNSTTVEEVQVFLSEFKNSFEYLNGVIAGKI